MRRGNESAVRTMDCGGERRQIPWSQNDARCSKAAHILNQRAKVAINLLTQTREIGEEKEEE